MCQPRQITPPPPHKILEQSCAYLKHLPRRTERNIEGLFYSKLNTRFLHKLSQSEQSDLKGTTALRVPQLCRRSHNYVRSCSHERTGHGQLSKIAICLLSFNFKCAFDRVSHKHRHYTLEQHGFNDKLVVLLGHLT